LAAESATTRLVKPGCRFCQWESGAGRVGGGWGRVALRLAVLRACLQNQLGGTGLRPVVSGDSPETAVGRRLALVSAANQQWTATDDIRRDARFDGRAARAVVKRGAHASRVRVRASRPNDSLPIPGKTGRKAGVTSFRRDAENGTPEACAPRLRGPGSGQDS
jgi:hypothetical protein